jgi:hypothetical protein
LRNPFIDIASAQTVIVQNPSHPSRPNVPLRKPGLNFTCRPDRQV